MYMFCNDFLVTLLTHTHLSTTFIPNGPSHVVQIMYLFIVNSTGLDQPGTMGQVEDFELALKFKIRIRIIIQTLTLEENPLQNTKTCISQPCPDIITVSNRSSVDLFDTVPCSLGASRDSLAPASLRWMMRRVP